MTKQAHDRLVADRLRETNELRNSRGLPSIGEPPRMFYGKDHAAIDLYMASGEGRQRQRGGR